MSSTLRVLLVDDDDEDAYLLRRLLGRAGLVHEPARCTTAEDALEHLRTGDVDLAFIDHYLGATTGLELIQQARTSGVASALIALTGGEDAELEARTLGAGAIDFIPKQDLSVPVLKRALRTARARTQAREEMEQLARKDGLTGLWNRTHFLDAVEHAVARARRHEHPVCVLYMDLDGFKPINDTYGHAAGDRLLQAFAARLQELVRETDTVARIGGDEFVVLLESLTCAEDAEPTQGRLSEALAAPYDLDGLSIRVGVSIGRASWPQDGATSKELLATADEAMLRHKRSGRLSGPTGVAPSPKMPLGDALRSALRQAVRRDELAIQWLPHVELGTGHPVCIEPRMAWERAPGTLVPVEVFRPTLDRLGLVPTTERQHLRRALATLGSLLDAHPGLTLGLPLPATPLRAEKTLSALEDALEDADVSPERVRVRLGRLCPRLTARLAPLWEQGLRVAVSSEALELSRVLDGLLSPVPVEALVLSRQLVSGLPDAASHRVTAAAVFAIADELGVPVHARGATAASHLAWLARRQVAVCSGPAVAGPLSEAALEPWMRERRRAA